MGSTRYPGPHYLNIPTKMVLTEAAKMLSKYALYQLQAQNAVGIVQLMQALQQRSGAVNRGLGPTETSLTLREDFCGTGLISLEWARCDVAQHRAVLVDNDPSPVEWGRTHNTWTPSALNRTQVIIADAVDEPTPADVVCACNFSWCGLRDDARLLEYFTASRQRSGVLILDMYGGPAAEGVGRWSAPLATPAGEGGEYTWEHKEWDSSVREVRAAMHFTVGEGEGGVEVRDAFTYHWRLRTLAEVREMLHAAGYTQVDGWVEERDAGGSGSGHIRRVDLADGMPGAYWTMHISAS